MWDFRRVLLNQESSQKATARYGCFRIEISSINNRNSPLEVDCHIVKILRNADVMVFLRAFTLYSKRKGLKKVVQNGLYLQSVFLII